MAEKISASDMMSNRPIPCFGCTLRHPTIGAIFNEVGYNTYLSFMSVLSMTPQSIVETFAVAAGVDPPELTIEQEAQMSVFDILFESDYLREQLRQALSFAIYEHVVPDRNNRRFVLYQDKKTPTGTSIDASNYSQIKSCILQLNCLGEDEEEDISKLKFASEKARKIYEKIRAERAKARRSRKPGSSDPNMALDNLVSAVCAYSNSIDYTNVWDLTLWQFYNTFHRINFRIYLEALAVRWGAWGKEDWDTKSWYQRMK